jgi:hypothetical protein
MREKFRVWAETLETFFLEVVFEERHDFRAKLTRGVLFGSSKLYQVGVEIHRWLINVRIFRDKTLGVQVIAIGNLTFGGTGKTPVVEKFARELQNAGRCTGKSWTKSSCARITRRRAWCPTANRCCSIPRWPATNRICSRRI